MPWFARENLWMFFNIQFCNVIITSLNVTRFFACSFRFLFQLLPPLEEGGLNGNRMSATNYHPTSIPLLRRGVMLPDSFESLVCTAKLVVLFSFYANLHDPLVLLVSCTHEHSSLKFLNFASLLPEVASVLNEFLSLYSEAAKVLHAAEVELERAERQQRHKRSISSVLKGALQRSPSVPRGAYLYVYTLIVKALYTTGIDDVAAEESARNDWELETAHTNGVLSQAALKRSVGQSPGRSVVIVASFRTMRNGSMVLLRLSVS